MNRNQLLDIRNKIDNSALKNIWTKQYKHLVKHVEPRLLRSKKRGKRSGTKLKHKQYNHRVPLPAILLSNVRSVLPKMDELAALLEISHIKYQAQVVCLTESWLTSNISDTQIELHGYCQFRTDRLTTSIKSKGGGLLMYISKLWSTNNEIINKHQANDLEMMTILSRPKWLPRELQSIIMVVCYAPCTGSNQRTTVISETARTIISHVHELEHKHPNSVIYVMGDFNRVKLNIASSYQQIVNKSTRGANTLDKCYVNIRGSYKYCRQLSHLGSSDHYMMHLIPCYLPKSKEKPQFISTRRYSEKNIKKLLATLDSTDWEELIKPEEDINTQVQVFTGYLNFCTDTHIPLKKAKRYPNSKPWITKDILELVRGKMKAFKAGNKKLVNKLKNRLKREIHKSRKLYAERIQQHMASDPSKAWTDIKKLSGQSATKQKPASMPHIKPDSLNQFFSRFEKTPSSKSPQNCHHQQCDPGDFPTCNIAETDVRKLLMWLNPRKGPGPDNIIPRVLKLCAQQLAPIITSLFQASIKQRTTPKLWKTAIIKPIPKTQRPTEPKHFRPIAITSCLSKLLEKVVKSHIMENTELDKFQFAYQPNRSTQDAVLCLVTTISEFIDKKPEHIARSLFLDFSSAFNTINVEILMERLVHLHPDIRGWIKSLLSDRIQYTSFDGILSRAIITNTGTPQGTVLSPLLFSIYTNIITSEEPTVSVLKYADDTVLTGLIANQSDQETYDSEIARICRLCKDLDLILNSDKTKEMLFSTKRTFPTVKPTLLNESSSPIELSTEIKYLGILIDNRLKFSSQCQLTISKANQKLYIVRRFKSLGSSPTLLAQLYNSFVASHVFYCLIIFYSNLSSTDKQALKKVHEQGRRLLGHNTTLDQIIKNKTASYAWKIFIDQQHFIHDFLNKLPSGRIQTFKFRSTIGRDCFLRKMILLVNG